MDDRARPESGIRPPMRRNFKNFLRLFLTSLRLSAFTFGGGYVIVSLMKKTMVEKLGWLREEEMQNFIALAQSAPGPIAVNTSVLVGWQLLGLGGAVTAVVGTILPPLLILSVISLYYDRLRDHPVVDFFMKGLMVGVCAVIFDVALDWAWQIFRRRIAAPILIFLAVFTAHFFFHLGVMEIILGCACVGLLLGAAADKRGEEWL